MKEILARIRRHLAALQAAIAELEEQLDSGDAGAPAQAPAAVEAARADDPGGGSLLMEGAAGAVAPEQPTEEESGELLGIAEPEAVEAPGRTGLAVALGRLQEVADFIEKQSLPVDPKHYGFIARIPNVLQSLSPEDQDSDRGAKAAAQCLGFLDEIAYLYDSSKYSGLANVIQSVEQGIANFLESHGAVIVPELGAPDAAALKAAQGAVAVQKVFSDQPAGAIAAVRKHAVMLQGRPLETGMVAVSAGPGPDIYALMRMAYDSLINAPSESAATTPARREAIARLRQYLDELATEEREAPMLARYAVNFLHEQNGTKAHDAAIEKLVAFLRKHGIAEIVVRIGDQFDDKYSPNKYERKRIPSNRPVNEVVRVIQRGFIDRSGVPIQKATVGVSKGPG